MNLKYYQKICDLIGFTPEFDAEASALLDKCELPQYCDPNTDKGIRVLEEFQGYSMNDEILMRRCIEIAAEAKARGDVPVGCLIVRGDEIIAEAGELIPASSVDVTAHAEVLAVRAACGKLGTSDLSGYTLVTTAEPCWMCAYAIRETGISRVVMGAPTPDVGALSTKYTLLTDDIGVWGAPPEVVMGVLAAACLALRG